MTKATLFMPLLNEGTDVWRPVTAKPLGDGTYQILGPMPDTEQWVFAPSTIVASRPKTFQDSENQLVAAPALHIRCDIS